MNWKKDHCACGAPATHVLEVDHRARGVPGFCCACFDREVKRGAQSCGCQHPISFHDERGCRVAHCGCALPKQNPAAGTSGAGR